MHLLTVEDQLIDKFRMGLVDNYYVSTINNNRFNETHQWMQKPVGDILEMGRIYTQPSRVFLHDTY